MILKKYYTPFILILLQVCGVMPIPLLEIVTDGGNMVETTPELAKPPKGIKWPSIKAVTLFLGGIKLYTSHQMPQENLKGIMRKCLFDQEKK